MYRPCDQSRKRSDAEIPRQCGSARVNGGKFTGEFDPFTG